MSKIPIGMGAAIAAARKKAGMSQAELGNLAGCTQSAVSSLEHELESKVAEPTILKIYEILEIEPPKGEVEKEGGVLRGVGIGMHGGYCPDCECPSNVPYLVGKRILFKPKLRKTGKFCPDCGEILEKRCPNCGAELNEGACCENCGEAYVAAAIAPGVDLVEYVKRRGAII